MKPIAGAASRGGRIGDLIGIAKTSTQTIAQGHVSTIKPLVISMHCNEPRKLGGQSVL
ncbi:hypothetical protein AKJ08_0037 [Vulgatibacter incomptus]|uniref:Uncharacterized protein n=1 Tax=Vulgatibacter incomptus TaxID=1391653 RepID=A0A0K1P805_9BACT|nr:hypothetical protein AKJ08_0037 [Vulgatibacter incomptus]